MFIVMQTENYNDLTMLSAWPTKAQAVAEATTQAARASLAPRGTDAWYDPIAMTSIRVMEVGYVHPNRIFVTTEGGLVQGIVADHPESVRVVVADFDVEGADPDTLDTMDGQTACLSLPGIKPITPRCRAWLAVPWVKDLLDGHMLPPTAGDPTS